MSVDDRLREGLERTAAEFVPGSGGGLDAVVATARRRRISRRVLAGAAAVGRPRCGCRTGPGRGTRDAAPSPVPAATTSATASPSASPSASASPTSAGDAAADAALASGLRGEWVTDVVTPEEATAALVRTGTAAHRDVVLADVGVPGRFTLTFDELGYRVSLDGEPEDEGTWYVEDGRLVLVPACDHCRVVLGPQLADGVLRLALLDDTSPDYQRVPSAAFTSALYTAAPFAVPDVPPALTRRRCPARAPSSRPTRSQE